MSKDLEWSIGSEELQVNFLEDMLNFRRFNNKNGKKAFIEFVKGVVKNKVTNREVDAVLLKSMSSYFKGNILTIDGLFFSSVGI